MISDIDDLEKQARIKNDKQADILCKKIMLCIGWTIVIILFIYALSIVIKS